MTEPAQILDFWFADGMQKQWFRAPPALDARIRARFESTWEAAARGEFSEWLQSPDGALALAIVLDQFPLNMYRGQPQAFATERQAIAISHDAIDRGHDRRLPHERVAFLYMPLMHSEEIDDQTLAVRLFERAGLSSNLRFARHHRDLIRRFGRFPHRNAILGRPSTPEELAYLASDEAFRG